MTETVSNPIRLADYKAPAFAIDQVELDFQLEPHATRVSNRIEIRRTEAGSTAPLWLDGVRLKLISIELDGKALTSADYVLTDEGLEIPALPDAFVLTTEVEIDPVANVALEEIGRAHV